MFTVYVLVCHLLAVKDKADRTMRHFHCHPKVQQWRWSFNIYDLLVSHPCFLKTEEMRVRYV